MLLFNWMPHCGSTSMLHAPPCTRTLECLVHLVLKGFESADMAPPSRSRGQRRAETRRKMSHGASTIPTTKKKHRAVKPKGPPTGQACASSTTVATRALRRRGVRGGGGARRARLHTNTGWECQQAGATEPAHAGLVARARAQGRRTSQLAAVQAFGQAANTRVRATRGAAGASEGGSECGIVGASGEDSGRKTSARRHVLLTLMEAQRPDERWARRRCRGKPPFFNFASMKSCWPTREAARLVGRIPQMSALN